jgi:hypothetical protein
MSYRFEMRRATGITVAVEIGDEDAAIDVIADAFEAFLLAAGFSQESVNTVLGPSPTP